MMPGPMLPGGSPGGIIGIPGCIRPGCIIIPGCIPAVKRCSSPAHWMHANCCGSRLLPALQAQVGLCKAGHRGRATHLEGARW